MSWSPIDQVQGQPSSAWRCCTTNLPAALQAFAVVSVTWSRSMSCAISHASIRSSVHSPCGRVPPRRSGCTPNAPKRRYEPSVRCSTWPSLGCRRAADHRSKFFRRQRREQDWRSRGRSRGTRRASVRANDPAAAVRRQKLASGPATSCSSCLFPRAHYFVELKRETLGAFAVSARDVIAQLANESFGAGHVRFRNIVGAVVDMPMRSHFSAAEAFFCDHFARLTCLPEISNVGPPD